MADITLLVPCYNAARYLPRLLESVRAQTIPFAKILCYDDGSTDDTVAVARDLGLEIIVGETNHGPAFARNRLLAGVDSTWIHFHDADDLLVPTYVEKITPFLDDQTDVAVCNMDWILETTRQTVIAWRFDAEALASDPVAANLTKPVAMIACVFRRERLLRIGGFDETLRTWEDGDLQVRLANSGARYRLHPEVLSISLRHDEGASTRYGDRVLEDRTRLLETYLHTLPPRYRPLIAGQAESHAAWLLEAKHRPDLAERDLAVCLAAGWTVPSTNNALLRLARAVLPARWLLVQQTRFRRRQAT